MWHILYKSATRICDIFSDIVSESQMRIRVTVGQAENRRSCMVEGT